jgi:hypothetical protein
MAFSFFKTTFRSNGNNKLQIIIESNQCTTLVGGYWTGVAEKK